MGFQLSFKDEFSNWMRLELTWPLHASLDTASHWLYKPGKPDSGAINLFMINVRTVWFEAVQCKVGTTLCLMMGKKLFLYCMVLNELTPYTVSPSSSFFNYLYSRYNNNSIAIEIFSNEEITARYIK